MPVYTDPRWQPESGGLPERQPCQCEYGNPFCTCRGLRSDTCAAGQPGIAGTITPPSPAEPEAARHPADARLSDAENALMAARRNAVNALEWIDRALRDLRKARQS
jgi:hypothetical protein